MPTAHSNLPASSSHMWLSCPPSLVMSKGIKEKPSEYAAEGTAAHAFAEYELCRHFGQDTEEKPESAYYNKEMESYVSSYTEWVIEQYNSLDAKVKTICFEQRLDYSEWAPDGWGTGDVVIIADGLLWIIDLKYGKGVPVSADHNPQLMLYGLGAYDAFSLSNDIQTVRMSINQPRLDSISTFEMPADELVKWGEEVVKPGALKAIAGEGEPTPGDHCRWCRAKALCRARAEEATKYIDADPRLMTAEEVSKMLEIAAKTKSWADDLKDYAQAKALEGQKWPGWKLVEGKSVRRYKDPQEVAKKLEAAGFEKAVIYKDPELLGLTAMEKVVGGKKKLEKLCEGLIIKPPGAPTLVPASDKREELNGSEVYNDDYKED